MMLMDMMHMTRTTALLVLAVLLLFSGCTVGQAGLSPQIDLTGTQAPGEAGDCVDSDRTFDYGDDSYYTRGTVSTSSGIETDLCKGDMLVEYACEYGFKKHVTVDCPFGCWEGACQTSIYEPPVVPFAQPPSTAPVVY
jgi:hypothetical protein